ncbi:MAG: glycosyltransferase family 4 protein, partial [Candidatus Binatia bacterium]
RVQPPCGATLVIVGGDERLRQYRRDAVDMGGRVHVTGPRRDVDALLAAADVVCVPSRQEAFGNVVLEACAAGVPVVTSRRVGAAELLQGLPGDLVVEDPEDVDALRAALVRALGDAWPQRSVAARTLAEALPWDRHLDQLERMLGEVAHAR